MGLGNTADGLFLAATSRLNEIGHHDCRLARRPREASRAWQTFEGFDFRRARDEHKVESLYCGRSLGAAAGWRINDHEVAIGRKGAPECLLKVVLGRELDQGERLFLGAPLAPV